MRAVHVLASLLLLNGAQAASPTASEWLRIDFDADLSSYLVDLKQVTRSGDTATLWELHVPGRTSISTGGESHTLIERIFDCKNGSQRLGAVQRFKQLSAKAQTIPHDDLSFKVQPGSMDDVEMKLACDNIVPAASAVNTRYASLTEAVKKAFGDAIKLPSAESNRTTRSLFPGGGPGGPAGPNPGPGQGGPAGPSGAPGRSPAN